MFSATAAAEPNTNFEELISTLSVGTRTAELQRVANENVSFLALSLVFDGPSFPPLTR